MRIILIIGYFICFYQFGYSQTDINPNINNDTILFPYDFFDHTTPLELTLEFDIKTYMNEKSIKEYLPARLTCFISDSLEIEKRVRIKARGMSRQRHCHFPSFWLNIKKSDINKDCIAESKKIKVVTLCRNNSDYKKYLLKEYLIYRLYNIITDNSFKVRLLKINYIDTGRRNKVTTNWAFMIEPEDLLAERLEAYPLKMNNIRYNQTDSILSATMSLFQYMIGNTDFSVAGRHNVKLLTLKEYLKPDILTIPYDFDYSGMVDAYYAVAADKFNIEDVTERYYYGMCRSDQLYNLVIDIYIEKKDEIFTLVQSFEHFDKRTRMYVLNYLEGFYEEIEDPKFIKNHIRPNCYNIN